MVKRSLNKLKGKLCLTKIKVIITLLYFLVNYNIILYIIILFITFFCIIEYKTIL